MVLPFYRIHDWVLRVDENKLYRQDREVSLEPRLANLLRFLADNPDTVFGRDELIESVWEGAVVTDQVVTQSIFELRKILKDGDTNPVDYIATVPKRGYKLVAPVSELEEVEVKGLTTPEESLPEEAAPVEAPFPAGPLTRSLSLRANQANRRGGRLRLLSFDLFVVLVLVALVSTLTWQQSKPHVQSVLDPELVVFRLHGGEGSEREGRLADGITRALMREVTAATPLRVQLDEAGLTGGIQPGREVSIRVARQSGGTYLDLEYRNHGVGRVMLSQQYQLGQQHVGAALAASSGDLLRALGSEHSEPGQEWPSDEGALVAMMEAYYYINSNQLESQRHGLGLLDRALQDEPDNALLLAERYLAGMVNLALGGKEEGTPLAESGQRLRGQAEGLSHGVASRVWEALALQALLEGDLSQSRQDLAQAAQHGQSVLYHILSGKLAELEGHAEMAGDAYAEAFLMEASEQTFRLCTHLGFDSNLETLAPYLYHSMTPSEVKLF